MPRLVGGVTETVCGGKLKKGKGFLKPNFETLPKLNKRGDRYDEYDGLICCFWLVVGRAFMEFQKISTGRYIVQSCAKGEIPGVRN
jgi:hypothetical protein